jgi:hypothetical protein
MVKTARVHTQSSCASTYCSHCSLTVLAAATLSLLVADPNVFAQPTALNVQITVFPVNGILYQANDDLTPGNQITPLSPIVTNSNFTVIYVNTGVNAFGWQQEIYDDLFQYQAQLTYNETSVESIVDGTNASHMCCKA